MLLGVYTQRYTLYELLFRFREMLTMQTSNLPRICCMEAAMRLIYFVSCYVMFAAGGRTSADGSVSEKPVEVVNPMKTNLAINHLFVVNKDQTTSQLPVLPPQSTSPTPSATGPGANSNATTDTTGF